MAEFRGLEILRQNLHDRYEDDQIISPVLTILLMFTFILIPSLLSFLNILYSSTADWGYIFSILAMSLMAVCVNVVTRAANHSRRDEEWMYAVNTCLGEMGIRTYGHRGSGIRGRRNQDRAALALLCILSVAIPFYLIFFAELLYIPLLISAAILVISSILVFGFPLRHDREQVEFTEFVSSCLSARGHRVRPMVPSVKNRLWIHVLAVIAYTAALAVAVFVYPGLPPATFLLLLFAALCVHGVAVFGLSLYDLNRHIHTQWAYEEYLYECLWLIHKTGGISKAVRSPEYGEEAIDRKRKVPPVLVLAEIFLLVMCIYYEIRLFGLLADAYVGYFGDVLHGNPFDPAFWTAKSAMMILLSTMYVLFFFLTVNAMLGIKSRRVTAWRSASRSCITFSLSAVVSYLVLQPGTVSAYFEFNIYLTVAVLYVLFLLLAVSESVQRYYTPFGCVVPPITSWIRYAFFGKIAFLPVGGYVAHEDWEAEVLPERDRGDSLTWSVPDGTSMFMLRVVVSPHPANPFRKDFERMALEIDGHILNIHPRGRFVFYVPEGARVVKWVQYNSIDEEPEYSLVFTEIFKSNTTLVISPVHGRSCMVTVVSWKNTDRHVVAPGNLRRWSRAERREWEADMARMRAELKRGMDPFGTLPDSKK